MYVLASIAPRRGSSQRVLVLDGNHVSCNLVATILRDAGFTTDTCTDRAQVLEALSTEQHRVLVADQHRGSGGDLEAIRALQARHPEVSLVLLAGDDRLESAVGALRAGVFDFMTRSFDLSTLAEHLLDAVRRAFDTTPGPAHGEAAPLSARDPIDDVLVGECLGIELARQTVRAAAASDGPVLLIGEPGTEKAAVARAIHAASARRERPFEVVETSRVDSGAELSKALRVTGDGEPGTLFFADVSALHAVWQVELVKRLSADADAAPRPRIIAGLSQPAHETWEGGVLRRLFQRLGGRELALPPLRERGRDVIILAEHFAEQSRLARGDASLRITEAAVEALSRYGWPRNVDELRFAIQHAASLCIDSRIRVVDLPPSIGLTLKSADLQGGTPLAVQSLEDMELSYILRVLDAVGGNKASAARLLGVDRTTLYRKLQRQEQSEPPPPSVAAPPRRPRRDSTAPPSRRVTAR